MSHPETRAVVIEESGAHLETFPTRALESGEVRVANSHTAVSVGTEFLVVSGQMHGCRFPALLGYMGVGEVVEVAPDVSSYRVGERVCSGLSDFQPAGYGQGAGNGHQSHPICSVKGDFAQEELARVPDGVSDGEAAYAWMGAVSAQGVDRAKVSDGDVIAVVGLGIVGQLAAQICRARGAKVFACDVNAHRAEMAGRYSADVVVAGDCALLNQRLREEFPGGASVVIECSGNTRVLDSALELAANEGRVVMQGHYPGEVRFRFIEAHSRRLTMVFPCAWGDLRPILRLMSEKKLTVSPFISGTFAPEEAGDLYARIGARDPHLGAALIRWKNGYKWSGKLTGR